MKINKKEVFAEIVGLSFGDGSLTKRKNTNYLRYQLRGDASEDREHYNNYIIPLFNEYITMPLTGKKCSVVESKKSCRSYGIAIQNVKIGNFLNNLGIPIGTKYELIIPKWIKKKKSLKSAFLRGLMDTDGSVFCQRNYVTNSTRHTQIRMKIVTASSVLANEVDKILNEFEIKHTLRTQISKRENMQDVYHIEIFAKKNVRKWFNEISSNNPKHLSKYFVWEKFGFCPPYSNLKQRKKMLNGEIDPSAFYNPSVIRDIIIAGVPERSNGLG